MSDTLREKFPDVTPVSSPPSLFSFNGIGLIFYGRRDHDAETGTFVKTRCLCLVFVPIFALDSWRVANANGGGWHLVGRCAISSLARFWNILVLVGILTGAGSIGWDAYTGTPGYQAGQRLAQGRQSEAKNQLAGAATSYAQVAEGDTEHARAAADALAALARGPLLQAGAEVQAQVIGQLASLRKKACVSGTMPAEVADLAERLAAAAGTPRAAISILDAAKPVLAKERLAAGRNKLLKSANAKDPKDAWVACELALAAEARGETERCRILLEPCSDRLGDGEGARILGGVYASQGRIEDSHRLLRPYVMARLKELQAAAAALEAAQESAMKAAYETLNHDGAGQDWYASYAMKDKPGKDQMVQEWVVQRLRGDAGIAGAERRLSAVAPVVSVALDLGIVTIQRAQGFTDPAQRKAELEEAERVFLAIRGVAGETDAYRLWLAQVDYWLGKPVEGRKLLDELLTAKKRDPKSLLAASDVLREVGDHAAARLLAEEAFTSAKAADVRYQAAITRSLLFVDLDDQIAWLERCDQGSAYILAELPAARGERLHRDGKDQEAMRELTRSLEAWSAMPRTATSLNNSATVAQRLYALSGDPEHQRVACSRLEEAHLLMPSNTILLSNLLSSRLELAGAECVRDLLDARALGRALDSGEFGYCYRDRAGREALTARYLANPARQHVVADAERMILMSPRSIEGYALMYADMVIARDAKALAAFSERTAAADIDHAAAWARSKEHLAGTKDAQRLAENAASVHRLEEQVAQLRKTGKAPTLALGLDLLLAEKLEAAGFGQPVDADACVALAEEAAQLHPSCATEAALVGVLIHRAAGRLAAADERLAAAIAAQRRLLTAGQVMLTLARDGHWRDRLGSDADLKRAASLVGAALERDPQSISLWDWALLAAIGDPGEAAVAAQLRGDPVLPHRVAIDQRLNPPGAVQALQSALFHRLNGDPGKADAVLEAARTSGLPLAIGL